MFLICMMYISWFKFFIDIIDISVLYRVLNIGICNIVFDLELFIWNGVYLWKYDYKNNVG